MNGIVLTIRPEPGCAATVEAAQALGLGLGLEGHPLFEIRPLAWEPPPPEDFDGLLLGSANAVRHGGPALGAFRAKPVYAVGDATGAAAEAAGFTLAATGRGELQGLLDTLAGPLRLLRLTAAEHVVIAPPAGIEVETRIAYESVALPLPRPLAERLGTGGLVLLHSAAAARHFARECDRLAVPRRSIGIAALGPRIAAAAGAGWRDVRSATEPREAALLALAREMCHDRSGG